MGCAFRGGRQLSLLVSSGDRMSGSATAPVTHSYHDSFWWEMEGGRDMGLFSVEAIPKWGVTLCGIVDLVDCISSPFPATPSVAILFGQKHWRWKQALAGERKGQLKGDRGFVRDLLLTAGSAPHLVLMDPTYVVITMPTSCQLRCRRSFVHQRDATVLGLIRLHLRKVATSEEPPK